MCNSDIVPLEVRVRDWPAQVLPHARRLAPYYIVYIASLGTGAKALGLPHSVNSSSWPIGHASRQVVEAAQRVGHLLDVAAGVLPSEP
ncbi:hypothetical protein ACFXKC_47285 [Streptomyces sp. NPDC059340]|uniref:hypothetical protein n=1 Tax=Streptomyces sp. NPDC059340 TaxID=3346806 RepID=UPI0036C1624C